MPRQLTHGEVTNSTRRYPITLFCPDWEDPRNVGAAFRLADAAGLQEVVLAGSTPRPPHPKINRTARSTVRSVPYREVADAAGYLEAAKQDGFLIIALEITSLSKSLFDYTLPPQAPIVLMAGTESSGLSPGLLALCDESVHLPMHGQNTSMNVAVALGAAVYLLLMKLQ